MPKPRVFVVALAVGFFLIGCFFSDALSGRVFVCRSDDDCAAGNECSGGVCSHQTGGPRPDGGAADAGDTTHPGVLSDGGLPHYRRAVTVTNTAAAQTSYAVQLAFDTQLLITTGKMASDCHDLVVTLADGQTLIPFWLANGCDTPSTVVWANVPTLGLGTTMLYLRYGAPTVTSASSGQQTFLFYDHFSSDPNSSWMNVFRHSGYRTDEFWWDGQSLFLTHAWSRLGGGGTMLNIDPSWEQGWAVHFQAAIGGWQGSGTGADGMAFGFFHQGNSYGTTGGQLAVDQLGYAVELDTYDNNLATDGGRLVAGGDPSAHHLALIRTDPTGVLSTSGYQHLAFVNTEAVADGGLHEYQIQFWQNSLSVSIDGVVVLTYSGAFDKTYRRMLFGAATGTFGDNHRLDEVIVRPHVSPEPTVVVSDSET
jgi:hypothetical protein